MKLDNKLPYIQLHTNDMLTIMNGFSMTARGVFITLICLTWSRRCECVKVDEIKEIAARGRVTNKRFERIKKELERYLTPRGEFKFTILEEMMNDAINISKERSKAAHKRWDKTEETGMH